VLLAVLALVVLASAVPVSAAHPPADVKLSRKTTAQKQQQPSKPRRPTSDGQKKDGQNKKEDTTVTVGRGTLDPIAPLTHGQTVEIRGTALRTGEVCALQMFYADKPAKVIRDAVPDEKKRCVFNVPVPDRPTALGAGKAKLILTKAISGKKSGEARQVFTVI
jgi:hypothetical protein